MAIKIVRESKYRHVFGEPSKQKYEDLRLSSKATESTGVRGNAKFIAVAWDAGGGGALAVIPISRFGRMPHDLPLITGHTGPILDFEFNPFDDNMLISASEDSTMKLWRIPDGGPPQHLREPLAVLQGHGKKVSFSTFNPVAGDIVASASFDQTCKIWNLNEQEQCFSIALPDQVLSLKWNYCGSLLAATCKDKKMRLIDPRTESVVAEVKVHDGSKATKLEWLGSPTATDECNKLVTTGFSSSAERQLGLWDIRTFSGSADVDALTMMNLDQGTGSLLPFFDAGTQMLYIAGKGDANVRYFEVSEAQPFLHYIDMYSATGPQKGFEFVPKRCVDVGQHEVMRGLKLETNAVVPISFKVPRKSDSFQDDIFPDCPAGVASLSGEDWLATDDVRPPVLMPMRQLKDGGGAAPKASPATRTGTQSSASVAGLAVKTKLAETEDRLREAEARIDALVKENELLREENQLLKA